MLFWEKRDGPIKESLRKKGVLYHFNFRSSPLVKMEVKLLHGRDNSEDPILSILRESAMCSKDVWVNIMCTFIN